MLLNLSRGMARTVRRAAIFPDFLSRQVDLPDDEEQAESGFCDQLPARLDLPGQPLDLAGCQGKLHRGESGSRGRDPFSSQLHSDAAQCRHFFLTPKTHI